MFAGENTPTQFYFYTCVCLFRNKVDENRWDVKFLRGDFENLHIMNLENKRTFVLVFVSSFTAGLFVCWPHKNINNLRSFLQPSREIVYLSGVRNILSCSNYIIWTIRDFKVHLTSSIASQIFSWRFLSDKASAWSKFDAFLWQLMWRMECLSWLNGLGVLEGLWTWVEVKWSLSRNAEKILLGVTGLTSHPCGTLI